MQPVCVSRPQSVGLRVNQAARESKHLINKTKNHYVTEGRSLPQDIASQVISLDKVEYIFY